jgi:cytochrome c oxidase subunit 1
MSHDPASHGHEHGHGDGHDHDPNAYHGPTTFWTKYIFSIDHKIIGLQFMFTSLMFVIVGGLLALGVRYELAWPQQEVPHRTILPAQMTQTGPESNVAQWKLGRKVKFMAETEVSGTKYPAGTIGYVAGFPKGYAVTIPYGTKIQGASFPLADNKIGYVKDMSSVMADYQYERQMLRAPVGTQVYEEGAPESAAPLVLAGAPDYQRSMGPDPVLLTMGHRIGDEVKQVTPVAISIPAQKVPEIVLAGAEQADVAAAEITVASGQVQYEKSTLKNEAYNQLFTMHASVMIFFVIIPMLVGAFGNFLVPLMIGAKDMAFPKLNMLSFWLAMPAGIVMIVSLWIDGGAAQGGWTNYPPLANSRFSSNLGTTLWVAGVALVGFSSIVGALNYITTTINMRAPGMTLTRMPLTVWSVLITSVLALLATPVLTAAMIMLVLDRTMGTQFFTDTVINSEGVQVAAGGQPLMWQHLFWFYSHPAVYIMILPAMGVTSDILSTFSRKPIFGYKPMVLAMGGITFLGFIVWGHHMFQSGMNPVLGTTFMASTIFIAVPSAIKTFNWLGTLWGGNIKFTPSMLFALGFVSMFVIGGLSGIFMASAPVDIPLHDTYFIVAHIHYVLFGGSIMGIFAGVYHWFPKMFGRQMNQKWGTIHFIMTFIAFNGTFFLMHILGIGGHPRRYATILKYDSLQHLQSMNVVMTIFAMMLGTAQLVFFYNFFRSLPRKVGRGILAVFAIGLVGPTVIGLSIWSAKNGIGWTPEMGAAAKRIITNVVATQPVVQVDGAAVRGAWQYTGAAVALGAVGLIATMAGLLVMLLRGLPTGGKIASLFIMLPALWFAITSLGAGGTVYDAQSQLIAGMESKKMWFDIMVGLGHGCVFGWIVVGLVWLVWDIGGKLKVPLIIEKSLYFWVLPMFLLPALLKHDTYMMLGQWPVIGWVIGPATYDFRWLFVLLSAVPGVVYLVLAKPKDEFGHNVGTNPWHANSLEWVATTSPPLAHGNFETIPTVYRGAYEYSSPVVKEDWLAQTAPLQPGEADLQHGH